jgi:chromosome segregation ATPase
MKLISLLVCFSFAALGQTPPADSPTLQTLLAEVHQLRIALERSNQIAPRIQILVERVKMQQEQEARIARQLDDARRELEHFQAESLRLQQQIQTIENAEAQTVDPEKRKDLDNALGQFKQEANQTEKSLQLAQMHEAELARQTQSEQAKLTELNDRLDRIEHALNTP